MVEILENISLKKFNTFGIEASARYFVEINHESDLTPLFADPKWQNATRLVLGGGSNLLLTQNFDGLVIRMNNKGIEYQILDDHILVTAGAGEVWDDLVNYCVDREFWGIENLSLIPGSVGASPIQNIGAYGVELKDVFESCIAFEIGTGRYVKFDKDGCRFAYRDSIFKQKKNRYIIVEVNFRLSKSPNINISYGAIAQELAARGIQQPGIKDISMVVAHIRVSKLPDPSTIGNAGSFFKNPVVPVAQFEQVIAKFPDIVHYPATEGFEKLAAGWLIEQCGWKGKTVGRTGTWKNQALVLVNHGGATGPEVYGLSSQIIDSVYSKFGVKLEREVNII